MTALRPRPRWLDSAMTFPTRAAPAARPGLFTFRSRLVHPDDRSPRYRNGMAQNNPYDLRVQSVKQRLHDDLVGENGRPADTNDVDRVVDAKAESLAGAPVQEFVPLLIEHQARDELREHGLHRDVADAGDESDDDLVGDRASGST
jgi:hypothetical protein